MVQKVDKVELMVYVVYGAGGGGYQDGSITVESTQLVVAHSMMLELF